MYDTHNFVLLYHLKLS